MVRPRGLHLQEKHVLVGGEPISASFFDFGLYLFHNAQNLLQKGTAPYYYLPKLQSHKEALLWNNILTFSEEELGLKKGTIRVTVLIETLFAAFEMDEILYQLREHITALNAGRWDYIFSIIKTLKNKRHFLLPDRSQITMTVPFMQAYTHLLVQTCHKRGAEAIGGMSAFVPKRNDPKVNEIALKKVKEDKFREAGEGFDGTWVAHPDLVATAKEAFNKKGQAKQEPVKTLDLLNFTIPDGQITEEGIRLNIQVCLQYLNSWLQGVGAVSIFNLMEDTATAEISRSQLWQWLHHGPTILQDGKEFTESLYKEILEEEYQALKKGKDIAQLAQAKKLLDQLVLPKDFPEFLTLLG